MGGVGENGDMAEERGLEPKSLGGVLITPAGCCREAKLEAGPQAFAGARRARDWARWLVLQPDGVAVSCSGPLATAYRLDFSGTPKTRSTVVCGTPTVLAMAAGFMPARKEARIRLALPSGTSRPSYGSTLALVPFAPRDLLSVC